MKTLSALTFGLVALLTTHALANDAHTPTTQILSGVFHGTTWRAVVPQPWSGLLLVESPTPSSDTPLDKPVDGPAMPNTALLEHGWAIATIKPEKTTTDATIDALRAARDQIAERLGCPRISIVTGQGPGGLLVLMMAERHSDEFHGFLACNPTGAADASAQPNLQPRGPLLILANEDSVPTAQQYVERAARNANAESVIPAYWYVPAETAHPNAPKPPPVLEAIDALASWINTRKQPESRPPPDEVKVRPTNNDEKTANDAFAAAAHCGSAALAEEAPALEDEPPTITVDD